MATKLKKAKSDPWAVLKKQASAADAPNAQACWNSRKSGRKVGDTLLGTAREIKDAMTPYGAGKVLEIETPDGKKEAVFLSVVLQNAIKSVGGFVAGDRVFIKWLGTPAGKRYAIYSVGKA